MKSIAFYLILMFLVYGIYSLVTNILASEANTRDDYIPENVLIISLGSKQLNRTDTNKQYYVIQCWLGLVFIILLLFAEFLTKYIEKGDENEVDEATLTAADFSIVI